MIKLPSHLLPEIKPARSETLGGSPLGQWFWSASWDTVSKEHLEKLQDNPPQKKTAFCMYPVYTIIYRLQPSVGKIKTSRPNFSWWAKRLDGSSPLFNWHAKELCRCIEGMKRMEFLWRRHLHRVFTHLSLLVDHPYPPRATKGLDQTLAERQEWQALGKCHSHTIRHTDETFASKSSYPAAHSAVCARPSLESLRIIRSAAEVTTWEECISWSAAGGSSRHDYGVTTGYYRHHYSWPTGLVFHGFPVVQKWVQPAGGFAVPPAAKTCRASKCSLAACACHLLTIQEGDQPL